MKVSILIACLFLVVLATATAADPLDTIPILDAYPTAGPCLTVAGTGNVLHQATGGYLVSTDVADPSAPVTLAVTWLGVQARHLTVFEQNGATLACVALGNPGLRLIDVADPTAPVVRGSLTDVAVWQTVWRAPRLYATAAQDGVLVIDPSDADAPHITATIPSRPGHEPRALATRQDRLFVACYDDTLEYYTLAEPDHPARLGAHIGRYHALACCGSSLLALTTTGLEIFDADNFNGLPLLGSWNPDDDSGRPMNVFGSGDHAWIADRVLGLHLIDLADPGAPTTVSLHPERPGQAWCVGGVGDHVALGLTAEGVRICDGSIGPITVLGTIADPHPASIDRVALSDDLVVGLDAGLALTVFNSLPGGAAAGQIRLEDVVSVDGFDADAGLAFVAGRLTGYPYTRLQLYDVSTPADPVRLYSGHGLPTTMQGTGEVAMDGPLAFVDCGGIYAYDLTDPGDPQHAGLYAFSEDTHGVTLVGPDMFCTWNGQDNRLVLVDRTDTWNMEELEVLPVPSAPTAVTAHGDRLYVAVTDDVWVFDVSVPGQSQHLGTVTVGGYVGDLAVGLDGMWVALGVLGLELWDLDDPAVPELLGTLTEQDRIDNVVAGGVTVVATAPHRGLLWLGGDVTGGIETPAAELALSQNAPNPFNPRTEISFTLDRGGPVQLTIHDLRGRTVRVLVAAELGVGLHRVEWDGRDRHGRSVPSGAYFYRLTADGRQMARKMLLLK